MTEGALALLTASSATRNAGLAQPRGAARLNGGFACYGSTATKTRYLAGRRLEPKLWVATNRASAVRRTSRAAVASGGQSKIRAEIAAICKPANAADWKEILRHHDCA